MHSLLMRIMKKKMKKDIWKWSVIRDIIKDKRQKTKKYLSILKYVIQKIENSQKKNLNKSDSKSMKKKRKNPEVFYINQLSFLTQNLLTKMAPVYINFLGKFHQIFLEQIIDNMYSLNHIKKKIFPNYVKTKGITVPDGII